MLEVGIHVIDDPVDFGFIKYPTNSAVRRCLEVASGHLQQEEVQKRESLDYVTGHSRLTDDTPARNHYQSLSRPSIQVSEA